MSIRQLAGEAKRLSAIEGPDYRIEDTADATMLKEECERRGLHLHWDPLRLPIEKRLVVRRVTIKEYSA
jgi:hypothetical protein